MHRTREWLVSGRVQGVAFRASTRRKALELGLGGLAENLLDGRVRVVGRGDPDALERFAEWLASGPAAARVDALIDGQDHDTPDDSPPGNFEIL